MSIHLARSFYTLAPMALVAMLGGCSKADEDKAGAVPNPTLQAQAAQASIASAQAAHDHPAMGMSEDDSAAASSAPTAMGAPDADSPPVSMGSVATGLAPTGMARMLGQPPMPGGSSAGGGLPPAMGAPHLYHLGADTFFLDQATAIGLTSEQQKTLTALKENAATSYATTQRKIDQDEQDLWVLSASEAPDVAKVETKIGEIARRTGQQRMDFIRIVGKAVGVLSDAQRRAVASQAAQAATMQQGAMPPTDAMPPAPGASGMSAGGAAPPSGGMGMGGPSKMPAGMGRGGGMAAPGAATGSMTDAGSSSGMGHM